MKSDRGRSFSGPYFFALRLNTERYSVCPRIKSESGKIRTRKTPNTDTFFAVSDAIPLKICYFMDIFGLVGFYNLCGFMFSIYKRKCLTISPFAETVGFKKRLNQF